MHAKDLVVAFLSQQTELQNLLLYFGGFEPAEFDLMSPSWNFQLKRLGLTINCTWIGLNEFLMKHRNVEAIVFYHTHEYLDAPNLLNDSVERFQTIGTLKVHGRRLSMFPNLKSIEIGNEYTNDDTRGFIQLFSIPHQLLKLIKLKEHLPIQFAYHVDEIPSDRSI